MKGAELSHYDVWAWDKNVINFTRAPHMLWVNVRRWREGKKANLIEPPRDFKALWSIFLSLSLSFAGLSNRPNLPTHRKTSLPKHTDVKSKFLEICHHTFSDDVKAALRLPSFDCYEFDDYEILHLMETMFIELNFIEKFHISPVRLREWLYEVYKHYNDVPFHNFRHCFCVSQMVSEIIF